MPSRGHSYEHTACLLLRQVYIVTDDCLYSPLLLYFLHMILEIWNEFLYRPLFNFLIWMYSNWTDNNLGWAIVYLTVILRVALLPFTYLAERNKVRNQDLVEDLKEKTKDYRKDPILQKEEIRKELRRRKVTPWSSAIVLGTQLLVLVLLYQVFMRGIAGEKVKILRSLYDSVDYPGAINTMFYGFDIGAAYDVFWSGAVALFFLLYIYFELKRNGRSLTKSDLAYFLLFPLTTFVVMWMLPMVKSLFILTSLVFSAIIHQFLRLFIKPKKRKG